MSSFFRPKHNHCQIIAKKSYFDEYPNIGRCSTKCESFKFQNEMTNSELNDCESNKRKRSDEEQIDSKKCKTTITLRKSPNLFAASSDEDSFQKVGEIIRHLCIISSFCKTVSKKNFFEKNNYFIGS